MSTIESTANNYLSELPEYTPLNADQEYSLAKRLRDHNDTNAEHQLIASQLRFVVFIAQGLKGYGLALEDLIQEGNIGLTKAVRRFDPDKGVRLNSYVGFAIKSEMYEYIIQNVRIVKVASTDEQRKLFFNLRSAKSDLGWLSSSEVSQLAKKLGVKRSSVIEMESRLSGRDTSFESPTENTEHSITPSPSDTLHKHNDDPSAKFENETDQEQSLEELKSGLETLDDRSRDILVSRWMADSKSSISQLARRYKVSADRIRQIEHKAMKKLRVELRGV